jgi:protein O-mannosyl-transferase
MRLGREMTTSKRDASKPLRCDLPICEDERVDPGGTSIPFGAKPMSPETLASVAEPEAPAASPVRLFRSRREATLLAALLLVLATLALYQRSLHNGFVNYDDPTYVTSNPHVLQGLSWSNIAWAFRSNVAGHWHPLTVISHMADVQLFGTNPAGHHLSSLFLHALNVALLFFLLRQATGYVARSAVVAGLFAACPLNVEAVAWISGRKAVLCTTFLLLALFAYGRYVRRPSVGRYMTLMLLFALGLMAEAMLITLPVVLLLADYWPLRRFESGPDAPEAAFGHDLLKLVTEKIPLFLIAVASAVTTLYAARRGGAVTPLSLFPLRLRIENAIYSYLVYVWKGVWPAHLAAIYPHPGRSLAIWKAVAAGIALLAITAIVFRYREKRYLLAGWLWFLVTMVPVIGIAQAGLQGMADRYAYIPFLGLFVMAVWFVADAAAAIKLPQAATAGVALLVLCGYAWVSYVQIGYWRNSYTLFSHATQVTTGNAVAENNLGLALGNEMGRPDLALPHYEAAVRFMPQWCTAHYDLAVVLQGQHRFDEAAREYQLALAYETDPDEAWRAHNNLGAVFVQLNRLPDAISEFTAALRVNPGDGMSLMNRGLVEYSQGKLDAAREDFSQAVQHAPTPQSYFWLGRVQEDQGSMQAAADAYQAALRMAPDLSDAQSRLDAVRQKLQR